MRLKSLDILYEDRHILICIKPSGIAVQSRSIQSPDMVSILKNHLAKDIVSADFSCEPYLAVIHRLDQPVQGIMVFAKTPFAAGELSRELRTGGFGKYYRALVSQNPPKPSDTLKNYLLKDKRSNTSRICEKSAAGAKPASLSYRTVPREERYFSFSQGSDTDAVPTELDIRLHTGRHHQIRVQLAGIGCPIIGDTKYNPASSKASGWQELKLCAYRLEITHPKTKKPMCFSLI